MSNINNKIQKTSANAMPALSTVTSKSGTRNTISQLSSSKSGSKINYGTSSFRPSTHSKKNKKECSETKHISEKDVMKWKGFNVQSNIEWTISEDTKEYLANIKDKKIFSCLPLPGKMDYDPFADYYENQSSRIQRPRREQKLPKRYQQQ